MVLDCKSAPVEPRHCFTLEEQAPSFCSQAYYCGKEIEVCLDDFRGEWLLLFFYSSDFTFV